MIPTPQSPSEVLSDKAANRLLADIAAAPADTEAERIELLEAACKIVGFRKGVTASRTTRINWRGVTEHEWQVYAWPDGTSWCNVSGATIDETLTALSREFRKVTLKARIEKDAEAAMKALDAADVADQMERAKVTTGPTNDATTDTLPLVKLGQGDYTRTINEGEVR